MPEIFGSIGYTISEQLENILKYWRKNDSNLEKVLNEDIAVIGTNNFHDNRINSFEKINMKVLDEILFKRQIYLFPDFILGHYIFPSSINVSMVNSLHKICSLLTNALYSGSYIRWFKYCSTYRHYQCPHNLYAENAVETAITLYDPQIFMKMLYLTTINKYSLVFIFERGDNYSPNILFTADSDLHFYSSPKSLNDFSVVTAPHHGSEANKLAYSQINGNNLIFVRSDRRQLKRPGPTFLNQQNRYCTVCRTNSRKQKIVIDFKNNNTKPRVSLKIVQKTGAILDVLKYNNSLKS